VKAIVLGAGGQLGIELSQQLGRRGHDVIALSREHLDITSSEAVDEAIDANQPDWVFNTAAYNFVDLAESEPEKAMAVNGIAVGGIARACQRHGAALVHYSTDHIFGGDKSEPYTEADLPAPPAAYGVSKLAGEHFARAFCERAYVVRVAGVFGPAGRTTNRGNFPELMLKKAAEGVALRVVEDFVATPTYAVPLASRSIDLVERTPPGLYHIGGGEAVSFYEWALKIFEAAGVEADLSPTNHLEFPTPARRPRQCSLSNAKVESLGLDPMPSLDEAHRDYFRRRNRQS